MEETLKTDCVVSETHEDSGGILGDLLTAGGTHQQQHMAQQHHTQQQVVKRKHRRGKPKCKNGNKPFKKTNWKFQMPRPNYQKNFGNAGGSMRRNNRSRLKLERSNSLAPYNTNKFLMEEHLAEVPSLLTPSGRTRDSSFSMDSEDNYFFSLPEDEEEFLTKEFANVYEKARVERLENLTKEELIEECLQIEDRYSTDQGTQQEQEMQVQRISAEFMTKIRFLEEKVRELTRENYNLRCQLMKSTTLAAAAAASPPSAAAPVGAACQPTPMDSEDSESDSSSSSSSSSSSRSGGVDDDMHCPRSRSNSLRSSLSDYNDFEEYNENEGNQNNEMNEIVEREEEDGAPLSASQMDEHYRQSANHSNGSCCSGGNASKENQEVPIANANTENAPADEQNPVNTSQPKVATAQKQFANENLNANVESMCD